MGVVIDMNKENTQDGISDVLNDRYIDVYMMRAGGNAFSAIAKHFGISISRTKEMFLKAEQELVSTKGAGKPWHHGLSERARNLLQEEGCGSREEVEDAIKSESALRNIPNIEEKTLNEIHEWLGMDTSTSESPLDVEIRRAIELLEQSGYVVTKRS